MRKDQAIAWYCYVNALQRNAVLESSSVEELDPRDKTDQSTPVEDLVSVALDDKQPG